MQRLPLLIILTALMLSACAVPSKRQLTGDEQGLSRTDAATSTPLAPLSNPPSGQGSSAEPSATDSPQPTPLSSEPTENLQVLPSPTPPAEATPTNPPAAIDLSGMTFVEKNNLYIQLLSEQQAAGKDTTAAEELYTHSLEATFAGDTAKSDQLLEQAIQLLFVNK